MGRAMFSPCYLTWGQNYGGGNEDNGDLLHKVPCRNCYTQCLQPWSRPPPHHASVGDSWTLMGMYGSVSCGVTAPFSWVLVHTNFCLCPPRVCFPVLCKFWWLCGGVNDDLLQEEYGLCHNQVCCTQSPCLCSSPLLTHTSTRHTQTQFCLSLCVVSAPWYTQGLFEPSEHLWLVWGFDSTCNFIPPTIFLGLLLCPWAWGISAKLLQCSTAAASVPTVFLGLLCLWTWGISSQSLWHHVATTPAHCFGLQNHCRWWLQPWN